MALVILVAGCGESGTTDSEKAADVEILNALLSRELTLVDAYARDMAPLRGQMRAVAGEFRGQGQAHVDALIKSIRGLGGETDAEAEEIEAPRPKGKEEALTLLYEEENAALAGAQEAVPQVENTAPRILAAALTASHAQHLVVLRQGLGVGLARSVPAPFESAEEPPPSAPAEGG